MPTSRATLYTAAVPRTANRATRIQRPAECFRQAMKSARRGSATQRGIPMKWCKGVSSPQFSLVVTPRIRRWSVVMAHRMPVARFASDGSGSVGQTGACDRGNFFVTGMNLLFASAPHGAPRMIGRADARCLISAPRVPALRCWEGRGQGRSLRLLGPVLRRAVPPFAPGARVLVAELFR